MDGKVIKLRDLNTSDCRSAFTSVQLWFLLIVPTISFIIDIFISTIDYITTFVKWATSSNNSEALQFLSAAQSFSSLFSILVKLFWFF